MPKISIIVPIYKVEPYLRRCVDSILNQTFTDFECILVDDGSPDNCPQICDEYAKKDTRIKVIHKANGGLSDARNAGIDIAQGEYLGFVDSDDWIHPQMYEILYKGIVENNVKLSVCAYNETDTEEEFERIDKPVFELYDGMKFLMTYNVAAVVAWNKLYHRSLFENIRYPVGRIHEDEFTTYKLLYNSGKIVFCNKNMYFYFMNENGITKGSYSLQKIDAIYALEERYRFAKKHKLLFQDDYNADQIIYNLWKYHSNLKDNPEYKSKERIICRKMRKYLFLYSRRLEININNHIEYFEIAFPKCIKIYKMLRK